MNVVFLDCTQNYTFQFSAGNKKVELLAKGLTEQGVHCHIINGIEGTKKVSEKTETTQPGIGTVTTYPAPRIPRTGFIVNYSTLKADLIRFRETDRNYLILAGAYIHIYRRYVRLGKKLGYKVVVISHEWLPTCHRDSALVRHMFKIYANTFGNDVDGILPISEYIIERIKKFNKPYLKTPILAEFPAQQPERQDNKQFAYCVFVDYRRVIDMVINAYRQYRSESGNPHSLILILTGDTRKIDSVREYIAANGLENDCIVKTAVPYAELEDIFRESSALLIPLDPDNEQDTARFSQKIAEYLASGSPVLTNNVGEIRNYFTPGQDVITFEYSESGLAKAFSQIEIHSVDLNKIATNGFNLGKTEFNYASFAPKLITFLRSL